MKLIDKEKLMPFVRFCIVGCFAAGLHYGIYFIMLLADIGENISYATGYIISFIANFFATNFYTFRTIPSWKKFVGFAGSHAVNFGLHIVLFNVFLWCGVHRLIAPPLVMLIAMLVQFTILNFIFKKKE